MEKCATAVSISEPFRFDDESSEEHIAHALASPVGTDIHRKFANAAITFPRSIRSSASPAYDLAVDMRNHGWITISYGSKPGLLFFRRPRLGFVRGDAVLDALIINL